MPVPAGRSEIVPKLYKWQGLLLDLAGVRIWVAETVLVMGMDTQSGNELSFVSSQTVTSRQDNSRPFKRLGNTLWSSTLYTWTTAYGESKEFLKAKYPDK